jgi:hypothetical protein
MTIEKLLLTDQPFEGALTAVELENHGQYIDMLLLIFCCADFMGETP